MTKRKKTLTSSPSPPFHPIMDPTLNTIMDKLHALSVQMTELLAKGDKHEATINEMRANLSSIIETSKEKDKTITRHTDQINTCEQALRSSSLRIIGLPLTKTSTNTDIINCVHEQILLPIMEAAKTKGEIDSRE